MVLSICVLLVGIFVIILPSCRNKVRITILSKYIGYTHKETSQLF